MSSTRLNGPKKLNGNAVVVGIAETTQIYEFVFDIWSDGNNCAAADLVAGTGRSIWGVLYEIPERYIARDPLRKIQTLDAIEGEGKNYSRMNIDLRYSNGSVIPGPVITYLGLKRVGNIRTSSEYVGHILQGLSERPEVPAEYVQYVRDRALANNPNLSFA